jgi:hypothetical protein
MMMKKQQTLVQEATRELTRLKSMQQKQDSLLHLESLQHSSHISMHS